MANFSLTFQQVSGETDFALYNPFLPLADDYSHLTTAKKEGEFLAIIRNKADRHNTHMFPASLSNP